MKQHFNLLLIVALIAMLAAGCQKEDALTVTLGAKIQKPISGDSKAYIDGYTPCWHNGDMVYINNTAYPVMAASGSSAQIENVTASSSYRAFFPASLLPETFGTNSNLNGDPSAAGVGINLPNVQHYELVGNHQRVDVPMGAYITSGSTLQFQNLCSIVRVTVSNSLNRELPLSRIKLQAETALLSGGGFFYYYSFYGGRHDSLHVKLESSRAQHSVYLDFTDDYPATVPALGTSTFDIVVPPFTTDDVTLTLYTTDLQCCSVTKEDVALAANTITTTTINVTSLAEIAAAELVDGPTFNAAIPDATTAIVFEYNSAVANGTRLSTINSPVPIYGNLDSDGTTWRISTPVHTINANPNCSNMFYGGSLNSWNTLQSIDFGDGFNTSNVTNMSSMFGYRQGLTSLDLSSFNTSSVTNMSYMFNECLGLTSLDVSHFNTSSVTNMNSMFLACMGLTSLDVSNFSTSNVTDMGSMFDYCTGLTSLDVSHFNTSNVTDMGSMFSNCIGLTSLDVSNFNTSNVTNMSSMFSDCPNLTSLDLSSFNTSNVTDMCGMFGYCQSLTSLDLSNFDMSNLGTTNQYYPTGKENMCTNLSTTSGHCTITCPLAVENAIKEVDPDYDPSPYHPHRYYFTNLPTSGVTFTWQRPTSSK